MDDIWIGGEGGRERGGREREREGEGEGEGRGKGEGEERREKRGREKERGREREREEKGEGERISVWGVRGRVIMVRRREEKLIGKQVSCSLRLLF